MCPSHAPSVRSFGLVDLPEFGLLGRLQLSLSFPVAALLLLLVGIDPVGWHSLVLDAVDQERSWGGLEAGERLRSFVDGCVGDANPFLNLFAGELFEQTADTGLVDADLLERLVQRIVRDDLLVLLGAVRERLAEVGAFEELVPRLRNRSRTSECPRPSSMIPCSNSSCIHSVRSNFRFSLFAGRAGPFAALLTPPPRLSRTS